MSINDLSVVELIPTPPPPAGPTAAGSHHIEEHTGRFLLVPLNLPPQRVTHEGVERHTPTASILLAPLNYIIPKRKLDVSDGISF